MLRRGEVRVNGARAKPDLRLAAGDVVRLPPWRRENEATRPAVSPAAVERLTRQILYEDDRLLVLNKPAGLAVHGGSGIRHGVIEILRAGPPGHSHLELAHRLDRDTSGCLLLARDRSMLRLLHGQLREGRVLKQYTALLKGQMQRPTLEIDDPLGRQREQGGERRVTVDAAGKPSATRIHRRRRYRQATLVNVGLLTGRTHQIRVHAASAGHPLAGDSKYGDRDFNQSMRRLGLKRMFLHAGRLELPDMDLAFEAPLPEELETVLERLS